MDEASVEIDIEYDAKGGRIVLSGIDAQFVRQMKKKMGGRKKVTLQPFDAGMVVSTNGIFLTSSETQQSIGYA